MLRNLGTSQIQSSRRIERGKGGIGSKRPRVCPAPVLTTGFCPHPSPEHGHASDPGAAGLASEHA
jgi:hypothetical protein